MQKWELCNYMNCRYCVVNGNWLKSYEGQLFGKLLSRLAFLELDKDMSLSFGIDF